MRFVLFDTINERHLAASLERALRRRGHEVLATGRIWKGQTFPNAAEHHDHVAPRVRQVLEWGPDALMCFRAAALRPRSIQVLRTAGVRTQLWLPDDPVLYRRLYRHLIDAYDDVLHCGSTRVLGFYEHKHGPTGVNFPFWTDDEAHPFVHDPDAADVDLVFLGHIVGPVRAWRYSVLAGLPFSVRQHGALEADPAGISGGRVRPEEVPQALARARAAINIPQRYSDYRGEPEDFPELAALGSFEAPSKLVQYAACGLPVLSLEADGEGDALPEMRIARDPAELAALAGELLADRAALRRVGRATRARFERWYSADRRAAFLERLVAEPGFWTDRSLNERATLWRGDDAVDTPPAAAPRRAVPEAEPPEVVVSGYYGARNVGDELILSAIASRLRRNGFEVVVAAQKPSAVQDEHGLKAFARADLAAAEPAVRRAVAVVVGGGGLIHDYTWDRAGGLSGLFQKPVLSLQGWAPLPLLAQMLGRPAHLFAVGVGPLADRDAQAFMRWLAERLDGLSVRDAESRELLLSIPGFSRPVGVVPDPVYALELGDAVAPAQLEHVAGRRVLAVNVRPWAHEGEEDMSARLARVVGRVAGRHELALAGVPFQDLGGADVTALETLFAAVPDDIPRTVLPWTADAAAIAGTLRASTAMLAMRLHANLLAHRLGVPAVGIAYDPKVSSHFEEVGRADACLELNAPEDELEAALEAAVTGGAEPPHGIADLERRAGDALDGLAAALPARELVLE